LLALVRGVLEDGKAEDVMVIDLFGKTSIADHMVIATGRSKRQIGALSENLVKAIKGAGAGVPGVEGRALADWVLVDAGDVIVHLFRPEVRAFYNLEKMWAVDLPAGASDPGRDAAVGR
jgi:ribosome-associated protein